METKNVWWCHDFRTLHCIWTIRACNWVALKYSIYNKNCVCVRVWKREREWETISTFELTDFHLFDLLQFVVAFFVFVQQPAVVLALNLVLVLQLVILLLQVVMLVLIKRKKKSAVIIWSRGCFYIKAYTRDSKSDKQINFTSKRQRM